MKEPRLFPNTVAGVLEALEMSFGKGIYMRIKLLSDYSRKTKSGDLEIVVSWLNIPMRWYVGGDCSGPYMHQHPSTKRKDLQKLFGIYWLWRGFSLPDWPKF